MAPIIRDATDRDVSLVTRLIRHSFRDVAERFGVTTENGRAHPSQCTEEWVRSALEWGIRFYVLEEEGVACACVAVGQAGRGLCKMERLGVLPGYRKRGLGKVLTWFALERARDRGARQVEVGIIADHTELIDWYGRLGFAVSEEAVSFEHLPFAVTFMVLDLQRG